MCLHHVAAAATLLLRLLRLLRLLLSLRTSPRKDWREDPAPAPFLSLIRFERVKRECENAGNAWDREGGGRGEGAMEEEEARQRRRRGTGG